MKATEYRERYPHLTVEDVYCWKCGAELEIKEQQVRYDKSSGAEMWTAKGVCPKRRYGSILNLGHEGDGKIFYIPPPPDDRG